MVGLTTCIVIGAGNFAQDHVDIGEEDFCIAVDGGYACCRQLGIEPDLIIGDMDSLPGNRRNHQSKAGNGGVPLSGKGRYRHAGSSSNRYAEGI